MMKAAKLATLGLTSRPHCSLLVAQLSAYYSQEATLNMLDGSWKIEPLHCDHSQAPSESYGRIINFDALVCVTSSMSTSSSTEETMLARSRDARLANATVGGALARTDCSDLGGEIVPAVTGSSSHEPSAICANPVRQRSTKEGVWKAG